jgi:hypothetical protein
MEEATEDGKKLLHSASGNGRNEGILLTTFIPEEIQV